MSKECKTNYSSKRKIVISGLIFLIILHLVQMIVMYIGLRSGVNENNITYINDRIISMDIMSGNFPWEIFIRPIVLIGIFAFIIWLNIKATEKEEKPIIKTHNTTAQEFYCDRCNHISFNKKCDVCNNNRTRPPEQNDFCFVAEKELLLSEEIVEVLRQNNVESSCKRMPSLGIAVITGSMFDLVGIYVPYESLKKATEIINEYYSEAIENIED